MYLYSLGTAFMKYYTSTVVTTTIVETQKSGNHSPRSVKSKLNGSRDGGMPAEVISVAGIINR